MTSFTKRNDAKSAPVERLAFSFIFAPSKGKSLDLILPPYEFIRGARDH